MAFKPEQLTADDKPKPDLSIRWRPGGGKELAAKVEKDKAVLEAEKIYREGVVSIRDLIAPDVFQVNPNYLQLGSRYVRTIFVITYPRYLYIGWFEGIINYNSTLDIGMYFYPVDSAIILKQLKNRAGVLEAQVSADAEKGAARDPLRETALRDIETLRDELTQGTEKFFQFGLYVTLYAEDKKELDQLSEKIEGIFGSRLVFSKRVLYQAEQGFTSTLPLALDELSVYFNMNSSPIATSFPFISSELTSDNGILYGINRHNNSLILFDRFSLQNANFCVFATSGAGKSYAIKLEILRSMMLGTDMIIIDPEREYKYLCDAVGGSYVDISLNSPNKINPFDLPKMVPKDSRPEDVLRSAVIAVKGLLRLMVGSLSAEEDSILDNALIETYARKDITPEADLTTVEPPLMKDLVDILSSMEGGHNLALRLGKYNDGTFAGLFNNPSNIDINNQLVVFSVRDLEDELRPLAIYNIVNYIWTIVRSKLKKRILTIDEGWWLMQHEDSAKFIYALVKRCRKYYLGVTTITQDVADFLNSPYGRAIVTNSALQLLLKQSPASIDVVQNTFMLTKAERYLLLESAVGEGIFFAGNKHAAIKIIASYTEDQIITSDPRQILEIEAAKEEFDQAYKEGQEGEAGAETEAGAAGETTEAGGGLQPLKI